MMHHPLSEWSFPWRRLIGLLQVLIVTPDLLRESNELLTSFTNLGNLIDHSSSPSGGGSVNNGYTSTAPTPLESSTDYHESQDCDDDDRPILTTTPSDSQSREVNNSDVAASQWTYAALRQLLYAQINDSNREKNNMRHISLSRNARPISSIAHQLLLLVLWPLLWSLPTDNSQALMHFWHHAPCTLLAVVVEL